MHFSRRLFWQTVASASAIGGAKRFIMASKGKGALREKRPFAVSIRV